jgi:hypothetical protein
MRFSTKFDDDESDFLYYGYRCYNPSLGRWLSRDPFLENGFWSVLDLADVPDFSSASSDYTILGNNIPNNLEYLGGCTCNFGAPSNGTPRGIKILTDSGVQTCNASNQGKTVTYTKGAGCACFCGDPQNCIVQYSYVCGNHTPSKPGKAPRRSQYTWFFSSATILSDCSTAPLPPKLPNG